MQTQLTPPRPQEYTGPRQPPGPAPRVAMVLYAPGRLCASLRLRPLWGAALLLGAVLVGASFLLIPTEMWDASFRRGVLSTGQELPEGFSLGGAARLLGLVAAAGSWTVMALLLAGILTVVFGVLLGDGARYRQYLALVSHALLIPALGALALVPLRLAAGDPQLNLDLGLFLGWLVGDGYLGRVVAMLDLLMLWAFAVMALGVAGLGARRSRGSSAGVLGTVALGTALLLALFTPS